jgi:hypothetical protein
MPDSRTVLPFPKLRNLIGVRASANPHALSLGARYVKNRSASISARNVFNRGQNRSYTR